jgi:opacity protein-like surface antigen
MRRILPFLLAATLLADVPAAAQTPRPQEPYPVISPRGFVLFGQQRFAAEQTFEAVFEKTALPFAGGGADIVLYRNFFAEIGFSRFEETGERVFRSGGETFKLGIPLTATITPFEISGGYRLTYWRRVIPYGGMGLASYHYEETSDFSQSGENVDESKRGLVVLGGAEVRVMRWIGVGLDVHYTSIDDILGSGGISQEFGESDLGGTAFRIRILVGR